MLKNLTCIVAVLFSGLVTLSTFAEEEVKELPPLDPAYEGIHGMALFGTSGDIFASHMPLYHKPHNAQLIYKVKSSNVALFQVVKDNELVTIKPEKFNLQRLMRGESFIINADIYIGHFEREGMLVYQNFPIEFDEQLYVREFTELAESSNKQEYEMIKYSQKSGHLFVHKITQAPSYDQILHIDLEAGCLTKFNTSSAVPKQNELLYKFMNCGTIKPMYFETQDFSKAH